MQLGWKVCLVRRKVDIFKAFKKLTLPYYFLGGHFSSHKSRVIFNIYFMLIFDVKSLGGLLKEPPNKFLKLFFLSFGLLPKRLSIALIPESLLTLSFWHEGFQLAANRSNQREMRA